MKVSYDHHPIKLSTSLQDICQQTNCFTVITLSLKDKQETIFFLLLLKWLELYQVLQTQTLQSPPP